MSKPKKPADSSSDRAKKCLLREISFMLRARGKQEKLVGVLLAHIPMGSTLAESSVRTSDPSAFEGFEAAHERRARAEVVVVRTNDPETGAVRFFTPRVQQVRWPS